MVYESSVTVDEVRTALNNISEDVVSDATIEQAIARAESKVEPYASGRVSQRDLKFAVIDWAAYRVVSTNRTLFKKSKGALDLSTSYDIQSWIESLRDNRDDSMEEISQETSPDLYTLGDRRQRNRTRFR